VIAIMSILFGVVFFSMDGFTASERLKADARNVAAFVRSVREQAISEGRSLYLVYDSAGGRCYACSGYSEVEGGKGEIQSYRLHDKVSLRGVRLNDGEKCEDGVVTVCVSATGDIEPHTVVLEGENGAVEVSTDGVLGTVKVSEVSR
jgi:Tfp pilus assembly protein FimT